MKLPTIPKLRDRLFALGRLAYGTPLPEIFFLVSLVLARYLNNSDFSYPREIILPSVLFAVLATIVFYAYRFVLKRRAAAHLASFLVLFSYYNFAGRFPKTQRVIDSVLPNSWETPFTKALVMMLVLALGAGLVAWGLAWLLGRYKALRRPELVKIFMFGIVFIFAWQAVRTGLRIYDVRHALAYKPPAVDLQPVKPPAAKKPNIYYLILDRYASNRTLKEVYNFDNSPTTDFLAEQGFVVRPDAYSNYPFTMQSVSSTLSMDYLPELAKFDRGSYQAAFPYRTILNNPPVAQILKESGYQYNQLSSWWDFTRVGIRANTNPTKSFRLRLFGLTLWQTDLERDILNKSIFSPLFKKGLTVGQTPVIKYDLDNNPQQNLDEQLAALRRLAVESGSGQQNQPQFNFAHILSPHDPYVFEADGSTPAYSADRTDNGLDEYAKYTRQLEYLNKRLREVVAEIRTHDPGAVVIIQPDEGPYPKEFRGTLSADHYYDPINLPAAQARQKFGILAAYYMPGVDPTKVTAELDSPVNAFRFVLNEYLGYSLPMLPDCQISAGNKFKIYNFAVANSLLGRPGEAECEGLGL